MKAEPVDPELFLRVWNAAMQAADSPNVVPFSRPLPMDDGSAIKLVNSPITRVMWAVHQATKDDMALAASVTLRIMAVVRAVSQGLLDDLMDETRTQVREDAIRAAAQAKMKRTGDLDLDDLRAKIPA